LFEKNIKIIELQDNSLKKDSEKYKKSALADEMQDALLDRILALMYLSNSMCRNILSNLLPTR